jgi:drug/metabolite transporter (DMT)-like permease
VSHLPITIFAYLLNSVSVTIDKLLLVKHIPNPLIYVFYISAIGAIGVVLIPFVKLPPPQAIAIASASTVLWTAGAYYMFKALKIGQVSRVIPVIGTLTPLFLLSNSIFQQTISTNEVWAIFILVFGIIFLTISDWRGKIKKEEILFTLLSSFLFAIAYILLREAYSYGDFLSIFVWSRPILIPLGLILLSIKKTRDIILNRHGEKLTLNNQGRILFLIGQISGGLSGILVTFAISLADPAIVNSLQGSQYMFLFILSAVLSKRFPDVFKEHYTKLILVLKIIGIFFISFGLYVLAISEIPEKDIKVGLTYSPRNALEIGLEPKETYLKMLDDLNPKYLRLPIYWDQVEEEFSRFNFSEVDFYLQEAEKRNINVILVLGYKQPRWPECYQPAWIQTIPEEHRKDKLLSLVASEIKYFRRYQAIKIWQIENEPFLHFFGDCKKEHAISFEILSEEISVIKALDNRPVLVTDSGELSPWLDAVGLSDVFGSTLYRTVKSPIFGLVDYPLPPFTYKLKEQIVRLMLAKPGDSIIAELQAEPWAINSRPVTSEPLETQMELFPPKKLLLNLDYAKETKFSQIYLWGVEWWYWMDQKGHPEYIETAKKVFE